MSDKKMTPIRDIARVIRSKNSGPYELTLDIIFRNRELMENVEASGVLNRSTIAGLYGIKEELITDILYFPPANAAKIVMIRTIVSGSPGDSDVYGAQQHAPLLKLEFPL
jgi:hypothetical protein